MSVLEESSVTSSVPASQSSVGLLLPRKSQCEWSLFWVTKETLVYMAAISLLSVGALVFIGFAIGSLFIDPYEENHHVPDVDVRFTKLFLMIKKIHF